jgi:hypothetical protein
MFVKGVLRPDSQFEKGLKYSLGLSILQGAQKAFLNVSESAHKVIEEPRKSFQFPFAILKRIAPLE